MGGLLEREELLGLLEEAQREGGRLVFVGGEAGVGKTAVVREFCERSRAGPERRLREPRDPEPARAVRRHRRSCARAA